MTRSSRCLLICLACWLSACGRKPAEMPFAESVRAQSLLISEIVTAADRTKIVKCPLSFQNADEGEVTVTLLGTGCSCYGVTLDGRPLAKGESFTIEPAGERHLNIAAAPPEVESEKEYRANFERRTPGGETRTIETRCRLAVYADVLVTPQLLSCRWEPGTELAGSRTVTIAHTFRGNSAQSRPPQLENLPEFAAAGPPQLVGDPEELEPGLWRETWLVTLTVSGNPPQDGSESTYPFGIRFADADGNPRAAATARFVVEQTLPLIYPNRLHFGTAIVGRTVERRLLIASRNASEFQLFADPELLPSDVSVEVDERVAARHWVTVRLTPEETGPIQRKLTLRSNRPDQPRLEMLIEAQVREAPAAALTP